MVELARLQLNHTVTLYVKSEIYFQAGNFDVSPKLTIDTSTSVSDLTKSIDDKKNQLIADYNSNFSQTYISARLNNWKNALENSIKTGWTEDARKYFVGKRILKEIQNWLFGTKNFLLWEHILDSDEPHCKQSYKELQDILNRI